MCFKKNEYFSPVGLKLNSFMINVVTTKKNFLGYWDVVKNVQKNTLVCKYLFEDGTMIVY